MYATQPRPEPITFYFILFHFISFYFILFYFILFYFILFILFILFYFILLILSMDWKPLKSRLLSMRQVLHYVTPCKQEEEAVSSVSRPSLYKQRTGESWRCVPRLIRSRHQYCPWQWSYSRGAHHSRSEEKTSNVME